MNKAFSIIHFIIVLTYHALSPFSLQHEFIYHILLLLTLTYQSLCKGKKVHCDFCGKNKVIVALLYSIKPTVNTNFKYVPRSSKASFSCCCWKQSFCSSCSSSISWSLPNGSMSNSSSLSCEIWGSDTKKSPWMISFQKVPTHKILTGTRVIFQKDYFVNFELNWVQLLTPFNE